jgi:hypothetical protein
MLLYGSAKRITYRTGAYVLGLYATRSRRSPRNATASMLCAACPFPLFRKACGFLRSEHFSAYSGVRPTRALVRLLQHFPV